ncbi:MAG: orotidine 5-phosphate decarboxylase [Nocardia sp.]|uniref:orotidine 5'-phosphate decarboxylase / HUMPS family protein n=1 Tax=Nocardia sp. TaxID=1821 RepID=UPI00262E6D66|nr:orotidine 5'-phosphate decarboxylase / HUMPS family protein [Nocardia sp.]MCU1640748.1 orotidine 5-phosphate decarboxylase [Nocardia sp.]
MPEALNTRLREWLSNGRPPIALILEPNRSALLHCGLPDTPLGALTLTGRVVAAARDLVPLIKIQPAAFERFGPEGWSACQEAIALIRAAEIGVLLDFKRADHAPVLTSLIATYTGPYSAYGADGLTLLPYLGLGEIDRAAEELAVHGGLLLVIAMTSNPGAELVQRAVSEGVPVAEAVVRSLPDHDGVGCVLGGSPQLAACLIESTDRLVVLPGWGRPGVDCAELLGARGAATDRVLFSIGSRLLADPARMREFLAEQAEWMASSIPRVARRRRNHTGAEIREGIGI